MDISVRVNIAPTLCAGAIYFPAPIFADDLRFPVDCTLGVDCVIQQYVDRDPGPGAQDFTCGPLSYDGHKGTDIRLMDQAAMRAGVDVLSATNGIVRGLRDGMLDALQGSEGAPNVDGRECGNGVIIERADGSTLQYCHLRNGSLRVRKGQKVKAGETLGQIGLSGRTQFPHVHLTIRNRDGDVVDPFDAREQTAACDLADTETLWTEADRPEYMPGGALSAGFSDGIPKYEDIRQGTASLSTLGAGSVALVFWAHFFGLREGDEIHLTFTGPEGEIANSTARMPRNRATEFRAVGRKSRGLWPTGAYSGLARLIRNDAEIARIERSFRIN
ncbi:MAG: M23 family metallopeptidase [Pseudomonadota bacterium]